MNKKNLVLDPVFVVSLLILLLNDFYFKQAYGNFLTGKISDLAGLIVFPVFTAYLFPRSVKWVSFVTGVLFATWKTPLTTPLIEFFNQYSALKIQRVIDYSDFLALLILPFTHTVINQDRRKVFKNNFILKAAKIALVLVSFFAICATSMPPPVEMPKGTIYIGKTYTVKKSKNEIIETIRSLGYNIDYYENPKDSAAIEDYYSPRKFPYYQTDNIVIYDDKSKPVDTILNIKYTLYELSEKKTRVEIINLTLSKDGNIQRWQTLKYFRKQYKKTIEKQVVNKIK